MIHMKWNELEEIFNTDDGSLPDIELNNLSSQEVIAGYEIVRNCAEKISSKNPSYWSISAGKEIEIQFDQNPVQHVIDQEAEPIHLCFAGIRSPSGKAVPELGIFVFTDSLVLDYRMGQEWNAEAIEGLFEIIKGIASISHNMELVHKSNTNDFDGNILTRAWREYSKRTS